MSAKEKLISISFLIFGILGCVEINFLLARKSEGKDGTLRYFEHPEVLTLMVCMGKTLCFVPYMLMKYSGSFSQGTLSFLHNRLFDRMIFWRILWTVVFSYYFLVSPIRQ